MLWKLRFFGKINIIRSAVKYIFSWVFRHGRTTIIPFGPISGFKWFCDKDHQFWMPLGLYEQETATWIIESLKRGGTFIDIGANAGYFTLIGSKSVGRDGRVFLFEPIPKNINMIKKHLQLNKIENVTVKEWLYQTSVERQNLLSSLLTRTPTWRKLISLMPILSQQVL